MAPEKSPGPPGSDSGLPGASFEQSIDRLRHATGVVIPIYLPASVAGDAGTSQAEQLLRDTVLGVCREVADPAVVCLSVDGVDNGAAVAAQLAEQFGTSLVVAPSNRGKLQAAREGARALLARGDLAYIAVVDDDNDHFANELLNFVRAAEHIAAQTRPQQTGVTPGRDVGPCLLILGRRISRHAPMGMLRGELEELADRMLLLALHYRAALSGKPLRLEYATMLDAVPDFHSGYKLFSRATAEAVFLPEVALAGLSEVAVYRHAVEAVMTVEALLAGAILGVVNRSTYNRQPVTRFGLLDRAALTADMILYPCRRLEVPRAFVRQWLADILPSLLLGTLVPEGREELAGVYRRVLEAYPDESKGGATADPFARQPLFL